MKINTINTIGGLFILALVLVSVAYAGSSGGPRRVWQVAQARPVAVRGAPKASDVSMRGLTIRSPKKGRGSEAHDTFQMVRDLHVTRLEWVYELTPEQVRQAKSLGLTVGGALSSAEPDAKGSLLAGRVTGRDGLPKTHKWFPAGRWVGCVNAPEYREAWLYQARRQVDAGVKVMQQDDPHMALRCTSLCYCKYCRSAFEKYQKTHGATASYERFQQDSVMAFHREMHQSLDLYARRHVPFSSNNLVGSSAGALDWTTDAFDFVNAEIYGARAEPVSLHAIAAVAHARGVPLVFQYRDTSVEHNRRSLAVFTANGVTMMMPWDVFMPGGAPRYFGTAAGYADLSGFIRAMARYLDGYEDAAVAGPGLRETRYGAGVPMELDGGSGQTFAFARALPRQAEAPAAIHLVEWSADAKPMTLRLRTENFTARGALNVKLMVPPPYDAAIHRDAQERLDFTALAVEAPVDVSVAGGVTVVKLPALHPWGILVVEGRTVAPASFQLLRLGCPAFGRYSCS